jgi:hypothetical protein
LFDDWFVKSEVFPKLFDKKLVGGTGFACHRIHGISRRKPDEKKIERGNREHDHHAFDHSFDDVGCSVHGLVPTGCGDGVRYGAR